MICNFNLIFAFFILNVINYKFLVVDCWQPYLDTSLDYAASPVDLGNLIKVESLLVLKLSTFLASPSFSNGSEFNLKHLNEYLEDFESTLLKDLGLNLKLFSKLVVRNVIDLEGFGEDAAKHPFKSYRTIRRLVRHAKKLQDVYKNTVISIEIEKHQKLQPFPQESDLTVASLAILRLNQLYKFPISHFLIGKLGNLETNCVLSIKHLLELGSIASFSQAVDFIATALNNFNGQKEERDRIQQLLEDAIQKHDNKILGGLGKDEIQPDSGPFFFNDLLLSSTHKNFAKRTPVTFEMLFGDIEEPPALGDYEGYKTMQAAFAYERLCRGETLRKISTLRCYTTTKPHPTFILQPLKVEVHNQSPLLVQYYDVVNEREIQELKAEVKGEMRMSRTIKTTDGVPSDETSRFRTSSNAWINDYDFSKFSYLTNRMSRTMGVNATGWLSTQDLQIVVYSPGGHYVPHTDAIFETNIVASLEPIELQKGDRIITFMIYLSDVESGGATVFPRLKTAVQPVKGSALVWYNLHSNGTINYETLHGGCGVTYGVKWIANKWVRMNDQMFLKRCPASRSQWELDF